VSVVEELIYQALLALTHHGPECMEGISRSLLESVPETYTSSSTSIDT
jgi:hypothetical protein